MSDYFDTVFMVGYVSGEIKRAYGDAVHPKKLYAIDKTVKALEAKQKGIPVPENYYKGICELAEFADMMPDQLVKLSEDMLADREKRAKIETADTNITLSTTTIHLLRWSKKTEENFRWTTVAKSLEDMYHRDMKLGDVMTVLLRSLNEVVLEKRFSCGDVSGLLHRILMAPAKGAVNINYLRSQKTGDEIPFMRTMYVELNDIATVEDFYDSIVCEIMGIYQLTNIGWCRHILFPEEE